MSTDSFMDPLKTSLEALGFVKVVKAEIAANQLRLLCRVTNKKAWCEVLERLMQGRKNWTEHICQQYFLKGSSLVYGWNIIINSADVAAAATEISRLLHVPAAVDVDTFPLRGAWRPPAGGSFNITAPGVGRGGPSQKGAHSVSSGGK